VDSPISPAPRAQPATSTQFELERLPPPASPVSVAVYGFVDQTGQYKPSEGVQTLSRAVSQGATSILVKALQDAGRRGWFTVVERERLDNVLKERQIIQEMRSTYLGERRIDPRVLPPLLFAGVLFEGGVIGYDSNVLTGGAGARFLGIGGSTEYRQDVVTVYLRAVSVKTGEVLNTVVARKKIASARINGDAFRFVSFQELLEAEAGITTNEPAEIALRQAIEKSVLAMIIEGSKVGLWGFADPEAARSWIERYERELARPSDPADPAGASANAEAAKHRTSTSGLGWHEEGARSSRTRSRPD
jgi:curli production assembly/transport component CsgG